MQQDGTVDARLHELVDFFILVGVMHAVHGDALPRGV
jgi:hypothetical protein